MFYYGSHVIHAASMAIFVHYQKQLQKLEDMEELVIFFNGKYLLMLLMMMMLMMMVI